MFLTLELLLLVAFVTLALELGGALLKMLLLLQIFRVNLAEARKSLRLQSALLRGHHYFGFLARLSEPELLNPLLFLGRLSLLSFNAKSLSTRLLLRCELLFGNDPESLCAGLLLLCVQLWQIDTKPVRAIDFLLLFVLDALRCHCNSHCRGAKSLCPHLLALLFGQGFQIY